MHEWIRKHKFSDLYDMSSGISTNSEQAGHGADFLSFSTVFNNQFIPDDLPDKMSASEREQNTYSIRKGDIFLTRTSETVDELGMSAVALKDYQEATFSGFLKRLRPKQSDKTCPKFMGFYLRSELFRKTMTNNAIMTLRASLNEQIFSYLDLLLPDFNNQKKIGDLLYSFNRKIEMNNRINSELEAMAKTIYDYWFVQFDFPISADLAASMGNPALAGKPYKSSGGEMVWNEKIKREVPKRWEVGSLLDVAKFINGLACQKFRPVDENKLRVIKIREMRDGFTENSEFVRADIPDKLIVDNGDVLFSWSASLEVQLWTGGKGGLNQHIFKVTSNEYPKSFYYFQLRNYLNYFKMVAELRKTTMGHITRDHLKQSAIIIPPKSLIQGLDKILAPMLQRMISTQTENQELASLRDWLLPMLMNGQVKVGEVKEYVQESEVGMAAEQNPNK